MREYNVTMQVTYEVYLSIQAESEEAATQHATQQCGDPELLSNHEFNVVNDYRLTSIKENEE